MGLSTRHAPSGESEVSARRGPCYPRLVASDDSEPRDRSLEEESLDHADALFAFGRRLTGSPSAAEDLVQETYVRALAKIASFERGTNLRAWLFRVLRNVYLDGVRRARSSPFSSEPLAEDPPEPADRALFGDLELERLRGVVVRDIETALAALSPESRLVVLLDLEGLSEREIAEATGSPAGTVKSRLFRARAALRALLGGYAP
jgi:RNA polymerase sigma-70 factor (ECF subfamily)